MVKICSYPSVGILASPHSTFHVILAVVYRGLMGPEYFSAVLRTALAKNLVKFGSIVPKWGKPSGGPTTHYYGRIQRARLHTRVEYGSSKLAR